MVYYKYLYIHNINDSCFTAVPSAICQGQSEATERPAVPRSSGTTIRMNADTKMVVPNLGLCRDGWSRGTMKEMSGKEIPICVKVNPKADTWKEAQATCRKHYGFLLKLGSNVQVNNDDLYSLLDTKGKILTQPHNVSQNVLIIHSTIVNINMKCE